MSSDLKRKTCCLHYFDLRSESELFNQRTEDHLSIIKIVVVVLMMGVAEYVCSINPLMECERNKVINENLASGFPLLDLTSNRLRLFELN